MWNKFDAKLTKLLPTDHNSQQLPLISISTSRVTDTELSSDLFKSMVNKTTNINKLIRLVAKLLLWRNKKITLGEAMTEAWIILLRKDQILHPPCSTKLTARSKSGVLFINRHVVNPEDFFSSKYQPILSFDSELKTMLLKRAHVEEKMFGMRDIHHSGKTTKLRLVSGLLGVHITQNKNEISKLIRNCVVCLRAEPRHYDVPLGPNYSITGAGKTPFEEISVDPLGVQRIRVMPGSRNKVPVYIIMVKDLNFGCIELVLSYSMDAAGIADCLRKMSYQLGVNILLVTTDAQPSYTSSNLNPDVEEGKLFGDCVFKRNVTHGQRYGGVHHEAHDARRQHQ